MKNEETTPHALIINVTEADVARAHARVADVPESQDPWQAYLELPEETREELLNECRKELFQRLELPMAWQQAIFADQLMERRGEEMNIIPARMDDGRTPIGANPRLACVASKYMENWFIPVNPTNQNILPQGTWEEWVELAEAIIREHQNGTE